PRSPIGGRSADAAATPQPRTRQDHRDGHARSQGRRVRLAYLASRQGHAGRAAAHGLSGSLAMKYFNLVWSALFRHKTRAVFTLISIIAAFLLFGLLNAECRDDGDQCEDGP